MHRACKQISFVAKCEDLFGPTVSRATPCVFLGIKGVARLSRAKIKGAHGNKPIHGCADFLGSPIAFSTSTFSDLDFSKGSIVETTCRRAPASPSPCRARLARPPWGRPSWATRPLSEPKREGGARGGPSSPRTLARRAATPPLRTTDARTTRAA
jgi:hypothetical protein